MLDAPAKTWTLIDYARILRRRIPYLIVSFLTLAVAAGSVVFLLPDFYRSTGKISVESQQIPADLVRSTVPGTANQRIGAIQQLVMTDARLSELIHKFGLYESYVKSHPMESVVEKFRKRITIESYSDPFSPNSGAISFEISFDDMDARTARDVAQALVQMFLDENVQTRSSRAADTADFLTVQADRLKAQVHMLDQSLADFKSKHSDALPEHLDLRMSMIQQGEFDLRAVQREISAAEQEVRLLEMQRDSFRNVVSQKTDGSAVVMSPEEQLSAYREELARISALYTESHPDVGRLKRLVASAEARVVSQARPRSARDEGKTSNVERGPIASKIAAAQTRLASLRAQERDLAVKMESLQSQILKTPETERGLRELMFAYESAAKDYESIRSRQQEAELAESLESEKMAERFVLLEPPTVAAVPFKPNRLKLLMIVLVAAIGAAAGIAFAAELLDDRIHDAQTLAGVLEGRPLAILPFVADAAERRREVGVYWLKWAAFLSLAGDCVNASCSLQ